MAGVQVQQRTNNSKQAVEHWRLKALEMSLSMDATKSPSDTPEQNSNTSAMSFVVSSTQAAWNCTMLEWRSRLWMRSSLPMPMVSTLTATGDLRNFPRRVRQKEPLPRRVGATCTASSSMSHRPRRQICCTV